jgi:acetoacetyl-CoA reductase
VHRACLAGQAGATNRVGIVTAKSGVIGFTKAVALETAGDGITVNAVSPGIIATQRDERQLSGMGDERLAREHYAAEAARIPVGRMGRTDEVSAAVAYLVSDEAGFVTGQVLNVNGGRYL